MKLRIRNLVSRALVRGSKVFSYGVYLRDANRIFRAINDNNIDYVVLRWFDELPALDPTEDIDVLVADTDFFRLKSILQRGRPGVAGFVKFDVYSESNLEGDIAYYPPHLAGQILANKRQLECGIWVPSVREHFLSLVYHALFHKGFSAGLSSEFPDKDVLNPKRDFATYLSDLSYQANIYVEKMSMAGLQSVLGDYGWLPPLDVFFRRSKKNEWVRLQANKIVDQSYRANHGLTVFMLREVISGNYLETSLKNLIVESGAIIQEEIKLTPAEARQLVQNTRGGDWGTPRLGKSFGGLPVKIIIAKPAQVESDLEPEELPSGSVEYNWVLKIKEEIRAKANAAIPRSMRCHLLHTSDNGIEAAHYRNLVYQIKAGTKGDQV